ncbi:hypothetical protein G6F46_008103 [Rhizopus delemar]|uniref:SMAD/FHA domain-containing protein n=3 Tax=Rhizopus TaxID=4842 RepID=I1C833_RHIO9|nr:hypothetical protein RO3G_09323 [Rhizopus delemar RA 99-880]KAG1455537.1 hypothetical protein G6F55_007015 [Rhizopus delemar]KAG1540655.1 hypothetical protein G6F51_008388 [Rhizopus arrhizus]KAG1494851.1 hypothetical protein G6F54_007583 [Rhizopus delemar]KAG1513734.1 hypothetical protein G6F53_004206 [Rhizopus delemar]|eukprot:EIE84613.1 hypothetical protein RO3G_09323 [Rhizopus delemar RA 99-880]
MTVKYAEDSIPNIKNTLFEKPSNNNNSGSSSSDEMKVHIRIVPNIDNSSRSLIFNVIERDLEVGKVIKIGRFTEKSYLEEHVSFKSKVVSRFHCEIWLNNDGKLQIKDTKSSSGTFINHIRLSPANQESQAEELRDGDLIQLGVDYQGGIQEMYRSVKMKLEINRRSVKQLSYSISAFHNLRNIITNKQLMTASSDIEECCICLYALAPFQALFVAPCSHSYHFKCIRPLFDSYPGFQCPVCRTYSDLNASVAVEAEEIIQKFGLKRIAQDNHSCEESEILHSLQGQLTPNDPPLLSTLIAYTSDLSTPSLVTSDIEVSGIAEHHDQFNPNTSTATTASEQKKKISRYNSTLIEKIKMAFSNERIRSTLSKKRVNSGGTSSGISEEIERSDNCFDCSLPNHLIHNFSCQSTHPNNLNEIMEEIGSNSSH